MPKTWSQPVRHATRSQPYANRATLDHTVSLACLGLFSFGRALIRTLGQANPRVGALRDRLDRPVRGAHADGEQAASVATAASTTRASVCSPDAPADALQYAAKTEQS